MQPRYVIRPDSQGFSVRDLLTGEPAVLAGTPQKALSRRDADHTAELLNKAAGDALEGPDAAHPETPGAPAS